MTSIDVIIQEIWRSDKHGMKIAKFKVLVLISSKLVLTLSC